MMIKTLFRLAAGLCLVVVFSTQPGCTKKKSTSVVSPLIRNGIPQYVILTDETPSPATRDAVKELNYWFQRISGTALAVSTVSKWDGVQPYIAVGRSKLTEENGWSSGEFAQEEARVFIEPGRIGLLGNDEAPYTGVSWSGTYYSSLEFVKNALGVRWIWPGELGEVFTPRKTIEVNARSWRWKPGITLVRGMWNGYASPIRAKSVTHTDTLGLPVPPDAWAELYNVQDQWLKRERMNKSSDVKFNHSFRDWWDKYSKTHPDWFAKPPEGITQRGGIGVKLNISNIEVQNEIFNNWKAAWNAAPGENRYLNIAPNDSRGFDTRPETRAWDAPGMQAFSDKEIFNGSAPVLSDRYVKFWNILAGRIRDVDPEAKVSTYAYRNYRKPPLGNEKIEDNVVIGYVGAEGYYPDERFIVDEWKEWTEKGAKLCWRPNVLNAGFGIPYLFSRQIFEDFKFFKQHSLQGTNFDNVVGNWAGQGLTYYILAEQHSRDEASYEELAAEYFDAFGPASTAIRAYHEFFEQESKKGPKLLREHGLVPNETWGGWWTGHIRVIPLLLTPEVAEKAEAMLAQAKKATEGGAPIYRDRVAFVERGFLHARLMSETFAKLNLQDPTKKASYEASRAILQPLWDYRQNLLVDYAVPVVRLFVEEQRQLGIWAAFVKNAPATKQESFSLAKGWELKLDSSNQGLREAWQNHFTSAGWTSTQTGMPWRQALPGQSKNGSRIAWYRITFEVPEIKDTGERIRLHFKSVDAEAKIWVNGTLVNERGYPHNGNYDSWNEPFDVDISRSARPGPQNELMLRVESESQNSGITGEVTLIIGE